MRKIQDLLLFVKADLFVTILSCTSCAEGIEYINNCRYTCMSSSFWCPVLSCHVPVFSFACRLIYVIVKNKKEQLKTY